MNSATRFSPYDITQWMSADLLAAYRKAIRTRRFASGQTVYHQDDAGTEMYRLASGCVRLTAGRSDGRELVYLLFEPGDCFGHSSLIDGEPRPQTAEAQTEIEVEILTRPAYLELRREHPEIDMVLLHLFARQLRLMIGHVADAHLDDLSSRIASRILDAVTAFGVPDASGYRLSIRLSQAELALMVGASRQSVNKVLQQFQSEGLIATEYGSVAVKDLPGLRKKSSLE